jgi:hypothetical protein
MLYGLVGRYQCFKRTCCIHLEGRRDSSTQKMVREYSFKHKNVSTKLYVTSQKTIILKNSKLHYTDTLKTYLIHATPVYEKHIIQRSITYTHIYIDLSLLPVCVKWISWFTRRTPSSIKLSKLFRLTEYTIPLFAKLSVTVWKEDVSHSHLVYYKHIYSEL